MYTLNTMANITANHILKLELPDSLPMGDYEVLLVLNEKNNNRSPLKFPSINTNINSAETFGRENIYGNEGR